MTELTTEERQRIYEEEKARLEAKERIVAEKKKGDAKSGAIGCVVILVLVGIIATLCSSGESDTKRDPTDRDTVISMAQVFMEKHVLKAPSSAKWPVYSEFVVSDLGGKRFKVSSYVDAENSFGAMIRTRFSITLKYAGNNQWTMEDASTDP